jgi:hypothetical protein
MIKEDTKNKKIRDLITRICDECGSEEKKTLGETIYSRSYKKYKKHLCKKCAYIYRVDNQKKGKESPFWTGGLSYNGNGYLRINLSGEYLHKKIYSDYIGRKLTRREQLHHIDMIKDNNNIDNLFLCKNKSKHHIIHRSMEKLGFTLLYKYIWFNKEKRIYQTKYYNCKNESNENIIIEPPTCQCLWRNDKCYDYIYVGYKKHQLYHRFVYEKINNIKLKSHEHIHHIDGHSLNNKISNLIKLDRSEHTTAHTSLQKCVAELYKKKKIFFTNGEYYK